MSQLRMWVFKILPQIKMNLLKVRQSGRTSVSVDYLWRADYKWDVVCLWSVWRVWTYGPPIFRQHYKAFCRDFKERNFYWKKVLSSKLTHCWQLFCWCSWCCWGWELVVTTLLWDPKSSVFSSDLISGNSVIASIFIVIWSECQWAGVRLRRHDVTGNSVVSSAWWEKCSVWGPELDCSHGKQECSSVARAPPACPPPPLHCTDYTQHCHTVLPTPPATTSNNNNNNNTARHQGESNIKKTRGQRLTGQWRVELIFPLWRHRRPHYTQGIMDQPERRERAQHNLPNIFFCLILFKYFPSVYISSGTKFDTLTLNGFPGRKIAKFIWDDTRQGWSWDWDFPIAGMPESASHNCLWYFATWEPE